MKKILDVYSEEDLLKADGFDDCDEGKVIKKLMKRDKMTRETALEFYTFNIIGAWVGKQTPVFIERIK